MVRRRPKPMSPTAGVKKKKYEKKKKMSKK